MQLLSLKSAVPLIGVYDGLSAHLAERSGAQALWVSGLCISASKALPDNETVTCDSLLSRLEDVRRGTTLPILADGNTGFGGPDAVGHLVRQLEDRDIDGVSIEDKAFPRRNSFADGKPCVLEEPAAYAEKLNRAAEARRGRLVLVARTEGLIAGESIETVLSRTELYCSAGADAIIVHSKSNTADEVLAFARAWRGPVPLIVIPTTFPQLSFARAASAGIAGVICANQVMRACVQAAEEYIQQLVKADSIQECEVPLFSLTGLLALVQGFNPDPVLR